MRYLIIILSLLVSVCCHAQINVNQGGTTAKNYYVEIPYQLVHGEIMINVEVGGKKHKFMFDTGAPTGISTALAEQLKAVTLGKFPVGDAGGRSDSVAFVRLDDLKIGNVSFSGIPALGKVPDFFDCIQAEGIIGSNLMRGSIVSLQSDRHMLIITDQSGKLKLDKTHASTMTIDSLQSQLFITIKLCGASLTMPFDTGMDGFMTFEEQVMEMMKKGGLGQCFEVADKGFGAGMIGAFGLQPYTGKYLVKFPLLQIGDVHFENVYAETNKDVTPVIGSHILNYGNVTLDYINKQFYFDTRTTSNNLDEKHWPFGITVKDGKLVIALIWSRGKGLVQLGEQILSIDGKDYQNVDICTAFKMKSPLEEKTSATLVIKDVLGKKRTMQISKL
ncbi:MAG: hypothetical protein JWQ57_1030 [Mucilaginibacter sp.]|nr:hypothetical protein [Mucilaginibacter sp.]